LRRQVRQLGDGDNAGFADDPARHPRLYLRLAGPLFACLLFAVLDLATGWVANRWIGLAAERLERRYRIPSTVYHHGLAPMVNTTAHWGPRAYSFLTNDLGLRDATARTVPLRWGGRRILFLGDSFTEGMGLPYEETYVGQVAAKLRLRGVDVLNAAVASYSPIVYARKLAALLDTGLQVTDVIVAIDISDIPDEVTRYRLDSSGRVIDAIRPAPRRELAEWLLSHSLSARLAWLGILWWEGLGERANLGLDKDQTLWDRDENVYRSYGALGAIYARQHMDSLLALAKREGLRLGVMIYPWPDEIFQFRSRQVEIWNTWSSSRGVPLLNLFPRFATPHPAETVRRYFIPGDVHWNQAGHQLVATAILSWIDSLPPQTAVDRPQCTSDRPQVQYPGPNEALRDRATSRTVP